MKKSIDDIFTNSTLREKVATTLPLLFQIAEINSSRNGKLGMEIGSEREKIIISLLLYYFKFENIDFNIPITEHEVDVKIIGKPVSIKTITGKTLNSFKLIWTSDNKKAKEFQKNYTPNCDIFLIHINWENQGAIYFIPLSVQMSVLSKQGKKIYIKIPPKGTNSRGVEISKQALNHLVSHKAVKVLPIFWKRYHLEQKIVYQKWIKYWKAKTVNQIINDLEQPN